MDLERALDPAYRIAVFADAEDVAAEDVIDLWAREGAVAGAEAQRRVAEVLMVATHGTDGLVGVLTAYVDRNPQLRMDLWYVRAFVSNDHRTANVAAQLIIHAVGLLEQRFENGLDERAGGVVLVVQNEGVKRGLPDAVWMPLAFHYIGDNVRGAHLRVHYFPRARAPLPSRPRLRLGSGLAIAWE